MKKNDSNNEDLHDSINNIGNGYPKTQKSLSLSEKNSEKISGDAWKVLAILSLIATMVTYAETMLIPAIPDLIKDFHISYNTSSWLMTMYLLAGAVMTPIAGKLSDIHGRKKILLMIMIIYAIGVSIAASSNTFYIMLIARAFQGVGMGMFPIAYTMIRSQFPRTKISIGQGIITSMYASGSVIGLVIGGSIIQYYGWHTTFLTVIPISIALLLTIWKYVNVKDHRYDNDDSTTNNKDNVKKIKRAPLDIKGAITLGIAIVSILLVFTFLQPQSQHQNPAASSSSASFIVENSNYHSNTITISFALLGMSSFIGFIMIERRASSPLIDLKLISSKTILLGNMIMLIIGMTMFLVMQTIPVLARSPYPLGFGDSVIEATQIQIPFSIILLIFGPMSGFIISKMGSKTPMIAGTIITTIGFFAIYALHSTQLLVSMDLAIVSVGLSFAAVGVMNIIILASPPRSMGISTGMTSLIRIVGSAIGPAIAGMFMQSQQQILKISGSAAAAAAAGAFPSPAAYNLIFLTATVLSASSIGFAIIIGRNRTNNNKTVLTPKIRVS
ncbi:MAG TPA: MFS transporter [Nitrososphaeraceae archaeon]|nr:MFS transporter [Nitrososphaeraceae archaeon]